MNFQSLLMEWVKGGVKRETSLRAVQRPVLVRVYPVVQLVHMPTEVQMSQFEGQPD